MSSWRENVLVSVGLAFATCAAGGAQGATFTAKTVGKVLYFDGEIDPQSALPIIKFIAGGGEKIVINSGGGDVSAGLSIAKVLATQDVQVVIDKYCLSSCANYVFLAARTKSLSPGAVLGFHGGLTSDTVFGTDKNGGGPGAAMNRLVRENSAFFKQIGIDEEVFGKSHRLTRIERPVTTFELSTNGSKETFDSQEGVTAAFASCLDKKQKCAISMSRRGVSSTKIYFPSREALIEFGVKGIGAYPYPADQEGMDKLAKSINDDTELIGDYGDAKLERGG